MHQAATIRALQRRIVDMQPLRLDERALPTPPGLRALLPGGALRMGSAYAVQGSRSLALAFLSEASASGRWCAVIGCPDLGAEAAAGLGIALDRCALIPEPGAHALGLVGLLSETFAVVALQHSGRVGAGDAERLAARLREHGSALVVMGGWPRVESSLRVTDSRWSGLGQGAGRLDERELTVQSQDRRGTRLHTVRFAGGALVDDPDSDTGDGTGGGTGGGIGGGTGGGIGTDEVPGGSGRGSDRETGAGASLPRRHDREQGREQGRERELVAL